MIHHPVGGSAFARSPAQRRAAAHLLVAAGVLASIGWTGGRGTMGDRCSTGEPLPATSVSLSPRLVERWMDDWTGNTAQARATVGGPASASAVATAPTLPWPTIYAGTWGYGTYQSLDRGHSWRRVDGGTAQVTSMAVYPDDPHSLIVGTANLGVIRITDDGRRLRESSSGLPDRYVRTVAIDRSSPPTLYAGTGSGLYRSVDDGVQWELFGLGGEEIDSIAIDDTRPNIVYAGTSAHGVLMTGDSGTTWINLGLNGMPVDALFLDPRPTGILLGGTAGGGVASISLPNLLPTIMARLDSPEHVRTMPGLGGSEAFGVSFVDEERKPSALSGPFGGTVIDLKIDPLSPATLYAATGAGVFKTTDGANTWHLSGLASVVVYALAVDPVNPLNVYAGTRAMGFYRSRDGGQTWDESPDRLIRDKIIYALAVDPAHPDTIYAGGRAANVNGADTGDWGGGLFKSTDGGTTWFAMNRGLPEGWVYAIAIDPWTPSTLYVGTHTRGVYKSVDGGFSWGSRNIGFLTGPNPDPHNMEIRSLAVNPQNPEDLIVGVWGGHGVFETKTGGESWAPAGGGIRRAKIRVVAYNPLAPDATYAGMASGGTMLRANANADTRWSPFPDQAQGGWNDFSIVNAIAIDPTNGSTIFLGLSGAGVLRSSDGGATWRSANDGLAATSVTGIVSDPACPSTLYASTNGAGVFRSLDGGASWSSFAWPGPMDWALDLAIETGEQARLYIATDKYGIGSLDLRATDSLAHLDLDDSG